ncbi:MAG: hypothetical protein C5B56_01655 [Proteobacteria bacterium]|nr:MAG: hypothetical protein C5B56_01655 [Pseudomonadota bacterium]
MGATRNADETEVTSNLAAFLLWLDATGREVSNADALRHWAGEDRAGFRRAVEAFAGLDPKHGPEGALTRFDGQRVALVIRANASREVWSRQSLRAGLPAAVRWRLQGATWDDLLDWTADHLFAAETRPDDVLVWDGPGDDPWPLGALAVGATLVLCPDEDAPSTAAAEHARGLRRASFVPKGKVKRPA